MTSKRAAALAAVVIAAMACSTPPAMAEICRIARVAKTGPTSVRLYLAPGSANGLRRSVDVVHAGAKKTYGITSPSSWQGPESARPGVDAQLGDRITSYNPTCEMTVRTQGGLIGVQVSEIARNPQLPSGLRSADPREAFVPAR